MSKTDTGGPAYPGGEFQEDSLEEGYFKGCPINPGMTLLDAAALAAFPEKMRIYSSDKDAANHAYHAGEEFIAEKRRREDE